MVFSFLLFFFTSAAGNSPYGLTPSSQSSSIMSPPPPPSSSQDGWSLNGDYSSAQVSFTDQEFANKTNKKSNFHISVE